MKIAGEEITKKAAEAIARRALELADDEGYCDEVERMLEEIGFPVPDIKRTVTLEVDISGRGGDVGESYVWTAYTGGNIETDEIRVVSVKSRS